MPRLVIMRGLPGSGKSTLARKLAGNSGIICGADDYFYDEKGVYQFNPSLLPKAHGACKQKVKTAMEKGISPIIVDNTNTRRSEYRQYVAMAEEHGYNIEFAVPNTPWAWNVEELARKTTHGVPIETIQKMYDRFEEPN